LDHQPDDGHAFEGRQRQHDADKAGHAAEEEALGFVSHLCASWIACQTRWGVAGIGRLRTPSGHSPSMMPFIVVGVEPTLPYSPTAKTLDVLWLTERRHTTTPAGPTRHGRKTGGL